MKKVLWAVMLIVICQANAQEAPQYEIKNLDQVNTKFADFGLSIYSGGVIFASSRKDQSATNKKWKGNHQRFLELYKGSIMEDGEITNIEYFSKNINTKYHESNAVFTQNMQRVFFSRNNYEDKKFKKSSKGWNLIQLYSADVGVNGDWTNVTPVPFNSDEFQTGHPALSADNKVLYFSSDRPGSIGGTDIWGVDINEDGSYGEPFHLKGDVNSSAKEMFPYVSKDNTLFYASNRSGGQGGLDIYKAKNTGDNTFQDSTILPSSINSSSDDFCYVEGTEANTGYFSSNRVGGKGDDDIYYFKVKEEELIEEVIDAPCTQSMDGVVRDQISQNLLPESTVELYKMKDGEIEEKIEGIIVGSDAKFTFTLECNQTYRVIGSKKGYVSDDEVITTNEDTGVSLDTTLALKEDVFDTNLQGEDIIKINPIYFNYDKSDIRPDAALELDKVVRVMQTYPDMIVQGGSYTDSRGRDQYNWDLSNRRAKATLQYIVEHGISPSRISATGYGETQLVNRCSNGVKCSDVEHQENRRTEFVVVKIN